jgi:crotonobetainyl-CoA hydratase
MSSVAIEKRGAVVAITISRPPANAIDGATSRALGAAFVAFRDDPDIRVAIVTGAGDRFFSAGWDLKAAAAGDDTDYGPGGFAGLTELFDLDKPVIAAVNGLCVGGGFELALAADLIVAAEHAEFLLPEIKIGIVPDAGGVLRLPRRLPRAVAMAMMMTGSRLAAADALRFGLANRVLPRGECMRAARALAEEIAGMAPLALRAIKAIANATEAMPVPAGFAAMRSGGIPIYQQMLASADAKEGPRAFAEKRSPVWRGR